jgi:hypothetical protein
MLTLIIICKFSFQHLIKIDNANKNYNLKILSSIVIIKFI